MAPGAIQKALKKALSSGGILYYLATMHLIVLPELAQ
jgi:hypothetical protein